MREVLQGDLRIWATIGKMVSLASKMSEAHQQPEPTAQSAPGRFALAAPLYFAAVILAVFGKGLFFGDGWIFSAVRHDLNLAYVPFLKFGFGELAKGNLPLWNPQSHCGMPFVGNIQSALFYPINWLHLIMPTWLAINWSIGIHFFLAGWFTSLWCRRRGLSTLACLLGGTTFMFSAGYFLHLYAGHLTFLAAMAWTPLILLMVDVLFDEAEKGTGPICAQHPTGRSGKWVLSPFLLLGAAAIALSIFAGHPQSVYYTGLAVGLYVMLRIWRANRPLRFILTLAAMYFAGVLLSAIQLLPTLQMAAESSRAGGVSYDFAAFGSAPPEALGTFISPHLFGSPSVRNLHDNLISAETPILKRYEHIRQNLYWEVLVYCGAGALVLALYGAIRGERRQQKYSRVMVLILIVLALGSFTPFFQLLYNYLPGYGSFRVTGRFNVLIALHIGMLAAIGLDASVRQIRDGRLVARGLLGLALIVILAGVLIALGTRGQAGRQAGQAILLGGLAMLLVASALLAAIHNSRWRVAPAAVAIIELILFAVLNTPMTPEVLPVPAEWTAAIAGRLPGSRVLTPGLAHANDCMMRGFEDLNGYDPVVLRRYLDVFAAAYGHNLDLHGLPPVRADAAFPPLFRMLRLGMALKAPSDPSSADVERAGMAERVDGSLPQALLVPAVSVIADRQIRLARLVRPDFDPRQTLILEEAPQPSVLGGPVEGDARVIRSDTDELEIEATTAKPAILLVTDSYSKHWTARGIGPSAGTTYRVLPANHTLRAIALPAGTHHILMEYRPSGFIIGRIITLAALAAYLILAGWAGWRWWRGRPCGALGIARMSF